MNAPPQDDEPSREARLRMTRAEIIQWLMALGSHNPAVAEQTCRGLAVRYRLDAARQRNPVEQHFAIESAAKFERLAEHLQSGRGVPS